MKQETHFNRKKMLLNAAFYICAALLFTVLAMFCFYRLGDKPIYDFDEFVNGGWYESVSDTDESRTYFWDMYSSQWLSG